MERKGSGKEASLTRAQELVAKIFEPLASRHRIELLMCLLEKEHQNVSELLQQIDIKPTTLSNHLGKLTRLGIIDCERIHRHRYYSIKDGRVKGILATLT